MLFLVLDGYVVLWMFIHCFCLFWGFVFGVSDDLCLFFVSLFRYLLDIAWSRGFGCGTGFASLCTLVTY